jgi:peptidoglycan/LPS O-acetylase OafA/YrhL
VALVPRRFPGLDAVRATALLGVVVIHADHWPLQDGGVDQAVWSGVDLLARVAVPLFVVLSGFLMTYGAQDRTPWRTFATRRLARTLVPWLGWTPVYAAAGLFLTGEVPRSLPGIGGWLSLGAGHLWFLVLVPQLYLLFLVWPRRARGLALAAALGLVVQTGLCVYRLYAPATDLLNGVFLDHGFELFPFWVGYFGIGAALGVRFASPGPRWPAWPFWVAVPVAALSLVGVDVSGAANAAFAQGTGAFLRPDLPLLAVPLFVAVALAADRVLTAHRRLSGAVALIGRYSLGIYIVHEALMYVPGRLLADGLLQRHLPTSVAGFALLVVATLVLAALLTRLLVGTPLAATLGVRRERLPFWATAGFARRRRSASSRASLPAQGVAGHPPQGGRDGPALLLHQRRLVLHRLLAPARGGAGDGERGSHA